MSVDNFLLSADTTDLNYPEIRPTLDLNFARVKALDPRIDFTRASGGSYVGADSLIKYAGVNEARFDHDPETGESLGLLVEEGRTNLLTNSNSLSGSRTSVTFDASVPAPDGSLMTQKVQSTTASGTNWSNSSNLINNGSGQTQTYCWSIFVKKGSYSIFRGQFGFINRGRVDYNFDTDTLVLVDDTLGGGRILYPNGWVRIFGYTDIGSGSTFSFLNVMTGVANKQGLNTFIYQWGMQVELGTFPTSYIPTQGSTRTRAADNAFISGNEFFNIFNENEGTFFSKSKTSGQGSGAFFVGDINTQPISKDYIDILRYQNNILRAGISLQETEGTSVAINSTLPLGDVYKAVHAYNLNKSVLYVDGNLIGRINSRKRIISKNLKILQIGKHRSGFYLNGHIYRLTYFNRLLQDSQLQALTR